MNSLSLSLALPDGRTLQIDVYSSKRARRLRLVSSIFGVRAVVPINYSSEELTSFVASKRDWIIKTSQHYSKVMERCGGHEPDMIYFLGKKYRFKVVKDRQSSTVVSDAIGVITFHVTDMRKYKQDIQEWYRQQIGRILADRLPYLSSKLNLNYNKVSIKNQKSRWASCSKTGNLNFNLLLATAPAEVIDYVIIHELIHLVELDHSPRFWQHVGAADSEYKAHKEWLAIHAPLIRIE